MKGFFGKGGMVVAAGQYLGWYNNWLPGPRNGQPFIPRSGPYNNMDLDGSTRITREKTGRDFFPYPWITGTVSGFMPMQDNLSLSWAWGKNAFGPGVNTPVSRPFDAQFPSLPKVSG